MSLETRIVINQEIGNEPEKKEQVVKKPPNDCKSTQLGQLLKCTLCNFNIDKKLLLKKHMILKHPEKIAEYLEIKCSFCDKVFNDPKQLKNHFNIHTGLKPFRCDQCELCFATNGELVRHNRYKHTAERPHKCDICDYTAVELSKLKRHFRVHTDERPYVCYACDYASRDTFKLKRHIRIHTGEKPYKCPTCESAFAQSNGLKVHMLKHHSINPIATSAGATTASNIIDSNSNQPVGDNNLDFNEIFECTECSIKFISKNLLNDHSLEHTGERPYNCEICNVKFARKSSLRSHQLSHNIEYTNDLKKRLRTINKQTNLANKKIPNDQKLSTSFSYVKNSKRKKHDDSSEEEGKDNNKKINLAEN